MGGGLQIISLIPVRLEMPRFCVSPVPLFGLAPAEMNTAVQLQQKSKTQHRKAYERPAGPEANV